MQLIELFLISAGTLLIALAFYLGTKQAGGKKGGGQDRVIEGLSPEKAVRLQTSLMRLLQELQALSGDMTTDLERKLSELKKLLGSADITNKEESTDIREEEEPSVEAEMEEQVEMEPPGDIAEISSYDSSAEDEVAPPPLSHRYSEIFQMAEDGLAIDEIARRMQMGKGEIQLILSLRQKD
jgi:hypothetical protein